MKCTYFALSICFWLLAASSCVVSADAHDSNVSSDDVPLRLVGGKNPLIVVPVYINGKGPYEFILDTGAFRCLLSPELSRTLGIEPEARQSATGIGGQVEMASARVSSFAIGSIRQENVDVAITSELSRFGDAVQSKVGGVVGFNFLQGLRFTVNYPRKLLRLTRSSPASQEETGNQLTDSASFKLADPSKPLILLSAFVNGRGPFIFVLDTGASKSIVSFNLARKLGIVAIGGRTGTATGGEVQILSGQVDTLAVGNAVVRDLSISVGEFFHDFSAASGIKFDGIIGENFLNNFEFTVDYPRGTLELKPAGAR